MSGTSCSGSTEGAVLVVEVVVVVVLDPPQCYWHWLIEMEARWKLNVVVGGTRLI